MPLTAQKVLAILKKAGAVHRGKLLWDESANCYLFEREGFGIWRKLGKPVTVEHDHRGHMPENWRETRTAKTLEYKTILEAAGCIVALCGYNGHVYWLEAKYPEDKTQFSRHALPETA